MQKHLKSPAPKNSGGLSVPQPRSSSVMAFSAYAATPQPASSLRASPSKRQMTNLLELAPSTLLPLNKDEVILNMPIIRNKSSMSNFNFTMTNPKFDRIKHLQNYKRNHKNENKTTYMGFAGFKDDRAMRKGVF